MTLMRKEVHDTVFTLADVLISSLIQTLVSSILMAKFLFYVTPDRIVVEFGMSMHVYVYVCFS